MHTQITLHLPALMNVYTERPQPFLSNAYLTVIFAKRMMNSTKNNSNSSTDSADYLFAEAARVLDNDESPVDSPTLAKVGEAPTITQ